MTDVDQAVRQSLRAWRTGIVTYAKRWLVFTAILFPVFTAYIRWTVPNVEVSLVVTFAVVLSLMVGYIASYVSLLGEHMLIRIREIIAEEETVTAAVRRLAILGAATGVSVMCGGLIIVGNSPVEFVVAGLLLLGSMLLSGTVVHNRMPTRELTADEREPCGTVIHHDAEFRKVVGEWGGTINGISTGALPSRETVLIHEQTFDQLEDDHIEALAAHELGHLVERHLPILVFSGTVGMYLVFLSIRAIIRGQLRSLLLFGSATLLVIGLTAKLKRYLEYRADAFAARYVGDVDQVIDDLRASDKDQRDGFAYSGKPVDNPVWTLPKTILRRWYRYTATHSYSV